jgi:siroheme synthase-like protein
MFFPVYLNLKGKRVVVIGGGEVAERKVLALTGTGASITVISPEVTTELARLAAAKSIEWHRRPYAPGDCKDAILVFSATDNREISRAVWEEAHRAGVLVNTADEPDLCDVIMPAVIRRGDLTVAISTGGASPALAATLREKLSQVLGPEYGQLVELLGRYRQEIQRRFQDERDRKALHYRLLDSDIIGFLQRNDSEGAERRLKEIIEAFACQEKTS